MTMSPKEYRKLFAERPFEPVALRLSDGRSVTVRHPDQVLILQTHLIVGLPGSHPIPDEVETADEPASLSMKINMMHVVAVDPLGEGNGAHAKRSDSSG